MTAKRQQIDDWRAGLACSTPGDERDVYVKELHATADAASKLAGELLGALERLASMEALTVARAMHPIRDEELIARIEYAREAIGE